MSSLGHLGPLPSMTTGSTADWHIDPDVGLRPEPSAAQKLKVIAPQSKSATLREVSEVAKNVNEHLDQMVCHAALAGLTDSEIAVAAQISLNRVRAALRKQ